MSSSDVSSVTKFFSTAAEGFTTTTSGTVSSGASSVGLNSVSGLTNGNVFVGIIEPGGAKQQVFTGTVDTGGSQITGVVWTRGTNVDHSTGVTVVDYVTGTSHSMMTKGILVAHDQTGVHKSGATYASPVFSGTATGTYTLGGTPTITSPTITGAVITNSNLSTTAGEIGAAWQSWTPTWTNVSGGTTTYSKYIQIGKTVFFRIKYTLTGAGVSGDVRFSLPTNLSSDYVNDDSIHSTSGFLDTSNNLYIAQIEVVSATTLSIRPINSAGTNGTYGAIASSTNPFSFGSGDTIFAYGTYEAA